MDNNEEKEIVKEETVAKKGKGKGILIGSLIAVIVLLAGVVVYFAFIKDKDKDTKKDDSSKPTNKVDNNTNNNDNNDDNNKPNNNDNDNNVTNTTVSDEKLSSIMKKFKKYGLFELKYGGNQEFSKDKITTYQYQNLESYILSNDTSDNWQEHFDNGEEYSASKSVADTYFKEVYGYIPNSYGDILCPLDEEALMFFKGDKYVWNDNHPGHGVPASNYEDYYIANSSVNGNLYTLDLVFLYGDYAETGFYINDDYIDDKVTYSDDAEYDEIIAEFKKYFNKHKEEYKNKAYKYTFEEKNGNFYLKSVKVK